MRLLLLMSFLASTVAADRLSWEPPAAPTRFILIVE